MFELDGEAEMGGRLLVLPLTGVKKRLLVGPTSEKGTRSVRKNNLSVSAAAPARLFAPEGIGHGEADGSANACGLQALCLEPAAPVACNCPAETLPACPASLASIGLPLIDGASGR